MARFSEPHFWTASEALKHGGTWFIFQEAGFRDYFPIADDPRRNHSPKLALATAKHTAHSYLKASSGLTQAALRDGKTENARLRVTAAARATAAVLSSNTKGSPTESLMK
jgi:hypothetical protein